MWFFRSPEIVFGEGALDHLADLEGHRAFIVTDENERAEIQRYIDILE